MFDLKCKRKGCSYNKNCNCTAKSIDIKEDTGCNTYFPSNEKEIGEVENTAKVTQPPVRKDIEVSCSADCLFNHNEICSANGITVQTCNNVACPNCCTYQPK